MRFFTVLEQIAALGPSEASCVANQGAGADAVSAAAAAAVPGPDVSPAVGITRGRVTLPVGIDWLEGSFRRDLRPVVIAIMSRYLGEGQVRDRGTPGGHYGQSMAWESGALLGWDESRPEAWFSLNGDSCSLVAVHQWRHLLRELAEMVGVKCTRIDLRADLPRDVLQLDDVHAAAMAGNVMRFRRFKQERPIKNIRTGELEGDAAYFGRRGNDGGGCYVRIYDKFLESRGEIDATRYEVELKSLRSQVSFEALASSMSDERMVAKIANILGGCIDFRVRGRHRHIERMPRVEWWQRIVDLLGEVRLVVHRVKAPLQETIEYFRDNWTRTLGLAVQVIEDAGHDGEAIILAWIRQGRLRARGWRQGARDLGLDVGELLGLNAQAARGVSR